MTQNPFLDGTIPFGPFTAGIHCSVPMDLLHGWCAGLFKNVLAASLAILLKIGGDSYGPVFATIEKHMSTIKRFPTCAGFSTTVFKNGLYHIVSVILLTYC